MDNRYLDIKQSVDTPFTIQFFDGETGDRTPVGLADNDSAEIAWCRASGEEVARMSTHSGDFKVTVENPGTNTEEALVMTFQGEKTRLWNLKPTTTQIVLDEADGRVLLGYEELFGTLLLTDNRSVDRPNASGMDLALKIELSTTRGVTDTGDIDTSGEGEPDA